MKATLFFSLAVLLTLTGCGPDKEPKPKLKYISRNCPTITNLRPIPKKIKTDAKNMKLNIQELPTDKTKFVVDKEELRKASQVAQSKNLLIKKQARYIYFYERQNNKLRKVCGQAHR